MVLYYYEWEEETKPVCKILEPGINPNSSWGWTVERWVANPPHPPPPKNLCAPLCLHVLFVQKWGVKTRSSLAQHFTLDVIFSHLKACQTQKRWTGRRWSEVRRIVFAAHVTADSYYSFRRISLCSQTCEQIGMTRRTRKEQNAPKGQECLKATIEDREGVEHVIH